MNTEFKGTDGPWIRNGHHISQEGKHPHGQSFVIDTDHVLKGIQDKEGISNAQLMATAPELLSALQTLIEKCLRVADTTLMHDELYNAKQVIQKAINPDTK